MCCSYQVIFCIVMGALAVGVAAPNLEKLSTARAAAYMIWNLIDRVVTVLVALFYHAGHIYSNKRKALVWCLSVHLSVCLTRHHSKQESCAVAKITV